MQTIKQSKLKKTAKKTNCGKYGQKMQIIQTSKERKKSHVSKMDGGTVSLKKKWLRKWILLQNFFYLWLFRFF